MSKIVEYMNEIGLTNFDNIQDYFFNSNLETIISLHEYLQELAYEDWSISDYSPYSFAPSMELCGFGGCEEYHCKLQRASVFNKFASLYGDTVYFIVNSITNPHIPDFFDDKHPFLVFELYSITSSTAFSEYFCEMGLSDNKESSLQIHFAKQSGQIEK